MEFPPEWSDEALAQRLRPVVAALNGDQRTDAAHAEVLLLDVLERRHATRAGERTRNVPDSREAPPRTIYRRMR